MKIVTVVGARPQFIKLAPVSRALGQSGVAEVVVHTGQHYDPMMSDTFFSELGIAKPQHHLGVGSGPHGQQTARMLEGIETVLVQEKPDWLLVYGDTNSTLAGALAAVKLGIPVAHVEAGARSFSRRMPEEINRVATDRISSLLFAASEAAVANLKREGVEPERINFAGDVMFDSVRLFSAMAEKSSRILDRVSVASKNYALATIHRAENTEDQAQVEALFDALAELSRDLPVVLPLHPRTRKMLSGSAAGKFESCGGKLLDPVGYFDMMMLERHAALIVTDSGGVQKEAFFQGVPCITLRDETEWVELVELGWNTLLPPKEAARLPEAAKRARSKKGAAASPYGDGHAAEKIAAALKAAI